MFQRYLVAVTQLVALRYGHARNQLARPANVPQRRQTRPRRETSNQITRNQVHIHQINKHYELMRNLARREKMKPL